MAYTKQNWADTSAGNTPISAERLTHMEDGIADAHDAADLAQTTATAAAGAVSGAQTAADAATAAADAATLAASSVLSATMVDSKGDLIVGQANDTIQRLPPGADGRWLETDSGEALGLKWGRKFTASATQPSGAQVGDLWLDLS